MTAYLENSAVGTGLEKVSFNSNPKERQRQRIFRLPHNCTHLYASKKGNAKEYSDYHAIVPIYMLVRRAMPKNIQTTMQLYSSIC